MPLIQLSTFIKAPVQRVFDLSRSIDLHKISTAHSKEEAVAGTTNGLINVNETVTWQAYHLFKKRRFTSVISEMTMPEHFRDEMTEGDFVSFKHDHYFDAAGGGTIMSDIIKFKSPYNIIGVIFNQAYLTGYLKKLTVKRNECIKLYAESGAWKSILNKNY
jgi:ligand-binding SRPBCC domain-containing protein